eukprot:1950565-Pleurochrysis_carterae.AAC.1
MEWLYIILAIIFLPPLIGVVLFVLFIFFLLLLAILSASAGKPAPLPVRKFIAACSDFRCGGKNEAGECAQFKDSGCPATAARPWIVREKPDGMREFVEPFDTLQAAQAHAQRPGDRFNTAPPMGRAMMLPDGTYKLS